MFYKIYPLALSIFFAIDIFWLGLVTKNFYRGQIGFLMKEHINWLAAFIFYFVFVAGLVFFVIQPALEKNSWLQALLLGSFFGLVTYSAYDLTNLAVLKNWPLWLTLVDLFWGALLSAGVSLLTFFIVNKFF